MSSLVSVPECEPGTIPDGSILSGGAVTSCCLLIHFQRLLLVFFTPFFFVSSLFSLTAVFLGGLI